MLPIAVGAFAVLSSFALGYGFGFDRGRAWRDSQRRPVLRRSSDGLPFVEWVERSR